MSSEIYWLTLTVLMTALFWVPYILNRMIEMGIWAAISNPNSDTTPRAAWAQRMTNAHSNAVENLVIFAPLVIAVHIVGTGNELTAIAVKTYFFVRLIHFVGYSAGIPLIRTIMFLIGVACQIVLALAVLGA